MTNLAINRGYAQRNWGNKRSNCKPYLCWNELVTPYHEYIDRRFVTKRCWCVCSSTCLAIVDLLKNNKLEEAQKLLEHIQ